MISSVSDAAIKYTDLAYGVMHAYADQLRKSHGFEAYGSGGSMTTCVRLMSLDFSCDRLVGVEEARILYINVVKGLLDKVNKDKEIRIYLDDFPFTYENTEISLVFLDKKGKEVCSEYIAYVSQLNGMIYYDVYDNGKYVNVYKEPYETALQKVRGVK